MRQLDTVKRQLHYVTTIQVADLEADLKDQKESRRSWQNKAGELEEKLADMENAHFVSVLIDADADIYYVCPQML